MILLGIDLETTGLDPQCCEVIEVGAVLWDTAVSQPIKIYSTVVKPKSPIPPEITGLTGITNEMVERFGTPWDTVLKTLQKLQEDCDYLVGHNAKHFDSECLAYHGMAFTKPWIDTITDLPYPEAITTRKLTHLAAEHGFINPFPHRAVTDVLTTLRILSTYPDDEIEKYAQAESVTLIAQFEKKDPDFEQKKEFVKRVRQFRWFPEPDFQWRKTLKSFMVEDEVRLLSEMNIGTTKL